MRDDQKQDRRAAHMTRLRDCTECYFKAMWAGLLATPVEIIHDASGASLYIRLEDITERVSLEMLNKKNVFYETQLSPENVRFKAMDLLKNAFLQCWLVLHSDEAKSNRG